MTERLPSFVLDPALPPSREVERFHTWCRQLDLAPRHFCCSTEPRQILAQRFARIAGLPALSAEQAVWLRDKVEMKRKLREIGMSTAEFSPIESIGEIRDFGAVGGWPIVVKPRDAWGCIGARKLVRPDEVDDLELDPGWRWMVESFVEDTEYEACALVFAGEVLDVWPSAFPAPPLAAAEGAINANISMGTRTLAGVDLGPYVQSIVTGMGLDHGYLHMELFVGDSGRCTASEIALRMAGCEIAKNHGLAYGFDIFGATIDTYIGRRPQLRYARQSCVGDLLLPIHPGRVARVTPIDALLEIEGVLEGNLGVRVGDVIPPVERASHSCAGYVHVEGQTVADVERRMHDVLDTFELEVDPIQAFHSGGPYC